MASLEPGVDIHIDRSNELREVLIPGIILPTIAVVLRFWSRWIIKDRNKTRFWWDDWFALLALPLSLALSIMTYYWSTIGAGRDITTIEPANRQTGLIILFIDFFLWSVGISLSKISVLCFYARVFRVSIGFKRAIWATLAVTVSWALFAVFSSIFQCTPVYKAWRPLDSTIGGTCIDYYIWFNSLAISSLLVDLLILLLPMPTLYKMHLTLTRKIMVFCVFLCGYSLIAFSIGRVITTKELGRDFIHNPTLSMVPIGRWLVLENPFCILCTCLPMHYSLFKRGAQHGFKAMFTSRYYAPKSTGFMYKTKTLDSLDSGRWSNDSGNSLAELYNKNHQSARRSDSTEALVMAQWSSTRSTFGDDAIASPITVPPRTHFIPRGNWI